MLGVVRVIAADVEGRECLRLILDDQPVGFESVSIVFSQIDQAGLRLADLHRFEEHPLQEGFEAGFRRQAVGDFEKACQCVFHACHRYAELVDLQHGGAPSDRVVEVEAADGIGFLYQCSQRFDQYSGGQPAQRYAEQQGGQGNQRALPAHSIGVHQ
ncbi:hypothetical protein D3C84_234220 [compost metagenome]